MLNIFRLMGDMSHLAAIVLLPFKLHISRSAAGVSLKSQQLYLIVFLARYLDLFVHFISFYNSVMKITYILLTAITIIMMRRRPSLKASYDSSTDSFRLWLHAIVPCLALAVVLQWEFWGDLTTTHAQVNFWWTFSQLLEPLAIVPQLLVFRRCTDAGRLAVVYVCLLAFYRGMYVLNWVWKSKYGLWYPHHPTMYFSALLQAALYIGFLCAHIKRNPRLQPDRNNLLERNSSAREPLLAEGGHIPPASVSVDSLTAEVTHQEHGNEAAPQGDSINEGRSLLPPPRVGSNGAVGGADESSVIAKFKSVVLTV